MEKDLSKHEFQYPYKVEEIVQPRTTIDHDPFIDDLETEALRQDLIKQHFIHDIFPKDFLNRDKYGV